MISLANSASAATQRPEALSQDLAPNKEAQKNSAPANDSGQTAVKISTKGLSLSLNGNQEAAFHGMATPVKSKAESQLSAAYTNVEIQ